jgi:hypothetical protein
MLVLEDKRKLHIGEFNAIVFFFIFVFIRENKTMGLKFTDFMGIIPAAVGRKGIKGLSPLGLLLSGDDDKNEKVVPAPKTAEDERMAGTKGLGVSTTTTTNTGGLKKGGKVAKAKAKKRKGFNGKGGGAALRGF